MSFFFLFTLLPNSSVNSNQVLMCCGRCWYVVILFVALLGYSFLSLSTSLHCWLLIWLALVCLQVGVVRVISLFFFFGGSSSTLIFLWPLIDPLFVEKYGFLPEKLLCSEGRRYSQASGGWYWTSFCRPLHHWSRS